MEGASAGLSVLFAAAQAAVGTPDARFFSTSVLVSVGVTVVDDQGAPVRGLGPEHFSLIVGGRPSPVVFAEYQSFTDAPDPASRSYSSNETAIPGRFLLFVVDRESLAGSGTRQVVTAAGRLLDHLRPADRAGLVTLPLGSGPQVDLTSDLAKVRQALGRSVGQQPFGHARVGPAEAAAIAGREGADGNAMDEVLNRECQWLRGAARDACVAQIRSEAGMVAAQTRQRTAQSLPALRDLMERLGPLPGPKTVLFLSEGMIVEDNLELERLGAAVSTAGVDLYVVLIESANADATVGRILSSDGAARRQQAASLEQMASLSGGRLARIASRGDAVFDRIAGEISGRYLLGFEPEAAWSDGRRHELRIEVNKPGLSVRAPRTVAVPKAPLTAPSGQSLLAAALRSPGLLVGLPLRVATFAVRDPDRSKVRILVSAEVGRRDEPPPEGVRLAFVLRDGNGQAVAAGSDDLPRTAQAPASFVGAAAVAPGHYTLKLVAIDGKGRQGSVEHGVRATLLEAGTLAVSDLILSDSSSLTLHPGVDPEFGAGDGLAYLEIYAREPGSLGEASVVVEVGGREDGAALVTIPLTLGPGKEADRRVAQGRLRVAGLSPGDYVASAVVSVSGKPVRRVQKRFRVAP